MLLASNRKFPVTYLDAAVLCIYYRPRRIKYTRCLYLTRPSEFPKELMSSTASKGF